VIVRSKAENYRLWTAGAYGNRLRAWRTEGEWRASGFSGPISVRYLGAGGGPCVYDVRPEEVPEVLSDLRRRGFDPELVTFNEGAPDDRVVLQGELFNGVVGGEVDRFECSTVRAKMREALRRERRVLTGVATRAVLRDLLSPGSWDDLNHLLDRFPDHVIEISVYSRFLGNTPRRNALVWEIRSY
jgi:hypothetical protein